MDKELKSIVIEIVAIVILMVIAIPICVNASRDYQAKKGDILESRRATINIGNTGKIKDVTVYSNAKKPIKINLYLKINKFDDDYVIGLDGKDYNIRDFDMSRRSLLGIVDLKCVELVVDDTQIIDNRVHILCISFYVNKYIVSFLCCCIGFYCCRSFVHGRK